MPEIIPAIIAKNFTELENKVKLVEPYVKTVQLDIMDGVFVPNITWPYFEGQSIADLARLETNLFIEAHLMAAEPENIIDAWLKSKIGRIIVHWEVLGAPGVIARSEPRSSGVNDEAISRHTTVAGINEDDSTRAGSPRSSFEGRARDDDVFNRVFSLVNKLRSNNKQFGIALNLETPIEVLDEFIDYIDLVLLMAVNPGFSGQKFQEEVIHKAEALRQKHGNVKMGIDGGINQNTVKKLDSVKVDFLAVGSAIFESGDVEKAIYEMKKIAEL